MSFTATSFIYDGIPSEMYGLVIANFDNEKQAVSNYGGEVKIIEDRFNGRAVGLHYGTTFNEPLSFPITLVVSDDTRRLDRYDQAAVAGWLIGQQEYKQLVICQPDMDGIFYRAIITELKSCEVGMRQVGFTATVVCDGPYAYRNTEDTVIQSAGESAYLYRNLSNVNDCYLPIITIDCIGTDFSLKNQTEGSIFTLSGMPSGTRTITVDCLNQILTSSDGLNLYQYWNSNSTKSFPRFARGDNNLTISGNCTIRIKNEFPWNVGN